MQNADLPEIPEGSILPPISLSPEQEELCRRLDALHQKNVKGQHPSTMFRGALFATREECRSNPDWMPQSAHSFREILYPFYGRGAKIKIMAALRSYGSATAGDVVLEEEIGRVYGQMTQVAHHDPKEIEEYMKLVEDFQRVLRKALARQIEIHEEIDRFFSENQPG